MIPTIREAIAMARTGKPSKILCTVHNENTPSMTVSRGDNGGVLLHCFGCNAEASAIVAAAGLTMRDIAPVELNGNGHHSAPASKPKYTPLDQAPSPCPPERFNHSKFGPPNHVWEYRTAAGAPICYVVRWNATDTRKKEIKQVTWACDTATGKLDWFWIGPESPKPLYRADVLTAKPEATVILCEGEKAADAAQRLFPELVATTWMGGTSAVKNANWKLLHNRKVIIWPDNDKPGANAAVSIHARLADSRIVTLPPGIPDKWDLADAESEGWTAERLAPFLPDLTTPEPPKSDTGLSLFYDSIRGNWWTTNSRGTYTTIDKDSAKKLVAMAGHYLCKEGDGMSEADREIIRLQLREDVTYAGPLAGYQVGRFDSGGVRVLVTDPCNPTVAVAGDYARLYQFLSSMLMDSQEQLWRFIYWLKLRREAIRTGRWRAGHACIFVGPASCGKSFTQNKIITPALGGRISKPWRYMSQATEFNSDLFGSEHLCIEDDAAARDLHTRRAIGANIKTMLFSPVQSCHAKGRPAISLEPRWAMSFSLNDEPENLQVLPPIDESLRDKLLIFKCQHPKIALPPNTDLTAYLTDILVELPAFLAMVDSAQIHEPWAEPRCGFTAYQHPEVLDEVGNLSPEHAMLEIMEDILFPSEIEAAWRGKASTLEKLLRDSARGGEISRLLTFPTACGVYLGRLKDKCPDRFERVRGRKANEWVIRPRTGD